VHQQQETSILEQLAILSAVYGLGAKMDLLKEITKSYPELTMEDFLPKSGSILLQDDSDGQGAYIAKWEYSKPIPEGFKLGK
jgi:hypothetical protein